MHKKNQQNNIDFYTPGGVHVFFKDQLSNDAVDTEDVLAKIESKIPQHLFSEIEMIIVGWFEEFEERNINAFYDSGTIYVSNIQDDGADMYDDIVHELAHALEEAHGYTIYADEKVKNEFLRKRKYLHDILLKHDFKAPMAFFMEVEFEQEFDDFLYKTAGYEKLSSLMQGLFLTPYAATSLREYFATGFTEFYLDPNHKFFKKVSPELYSKIYQLQNPDELDNR